jgi:hypothetical protein
LSTAALLAAFAAPPAAHAAGGLRLGFTDGGAFTSLVAADNEVNLGHAASAGATVARFSIGWNGVAPVAPPGKLVAADPSWAGYRWAATDQWVRDVAASGLRPLAVVNSAPAWAEGAHRPATAKGGTWNPSPTAFGLFARALARRYSGHFPDPLHPGRMLPAIRDWQVWNEPNLTIFLGPQWRRLSHRYVPNSPTLYRGLLNAFYNGVKSISSRNYVVTAGAAPFGDPAGGARMAPARFWRSLFCVKGDAHPVSTHCRTPVSFDAIAHHPYTVGAPDHHALSPDDVSVPDLAKITRPLAVAVRAGTVRPRRTKPLWITEIAWDSRPDPDGLTLAKQATYLEESLYLLWRQGASVITWYLLRDEPPVPSYPLSRQTGVFLRGATPSADRRKPSFTAFRFPFTAVRSGGVARLWGMVPDAGKRTSVVVERRRGSRWVRVTTLRSGTDRLFTGRVAVRAGVRLRARTAHDTSLAWTTS